MIGKQLIAQFKVLCRNLLGDTEENYEEPQSKQQVSCRDLNLGPSEYESGVRLLETIGTAPAGHVARTGR
jgi:hypothetical protein